MFIIEKNSWMKDKGNLDSHSISAIYCHTRFISVASTNRVCSLTHAKEKRKPSPPSSPPTRRGLLRNSAPHQLLSRRPPYARRLLSTGGGRAPNSTGFRPTAFRRLSALTFYTLVDWSFLRDWAGDFSQGEGNQVSEIFTHLLSQFIHRC